LINIFFLTNKNLFKKEKFSLITILHHQKHVILSRNIRKKKILLKCALIVLKNKYCSSVFAAGKLFIVLFFSIKFHFKQVALNINDCANKKLKIHEKKNKVK